MTITRRTRFSVLFALAFSVASMLLTGPALAQADRGGQFQLSPASDPAKLLGVEGAFVVLVDGRSNTPSPGYMVSMLGEVYFIPLYARGLGLLGGLTAEGLSVMSKLTLEAVRGKPGYWRLKVNDGDYLVAEDGRLGTQNGKLGAEWILWNATPGIGAQWMHNVADATPLTRLSLPGSHDSGADYGCDGPNSRFAKTQDLSIRAQLDAGVRYLDIRLVTNQGGFAVHHGPCFQHLMFRGVLRDVQAFLRDNPSETVLMRVKNEASENPLQSAAGWVDGATGGDGVVNNRHNMPLAKQHFATIQREFSGLFYNRPRGSGYPTMGQARGKVVVLQQFGEFGDDLSYPWSAVSTDTGSETDYYAPELKDKVDAMNKQLERARTGAERTLYMMSTAATESSGKAGDQISGVLGIAWGPRDYATKLNPPVITFFGGAKLAGPYGIVATDFTEHTMAKGIIESNPSAAAIPRPGRQVPTLGVQRTGTIAAKMSGNKCLDLRSDQRRAKVLLSPCGEAQARPYQQWVFTERGQIRNAQTDMCLDLASTEEGSPFLMSYCRESGSALFQQFRWKGDALQNVRSGDCVDLRSYERGSEIILWKCKSLTTDTSQHFVMTAGDRSGTR